VRIYLRGDQMVLLCPEHPTVKRLPASWYKKQLRETRRALSAPAPLAPLKPWPAWHPNSGQKFNDGDGI
jgi:hypothetical protein